jgi:ribosomal protein S18 acetylase RimI-like enzyme
LVNSILGQTLSTYFSLWDSMRTSKIRPATISDISSIVEIRLGAVTEEEISEFGVPEDNLYTSIIKLREMWDFGNRLKEGFEVFVAEEQGKVIGFIVFIMKGDDNIDNIVVAKDEQGKGVGRALVEFVEELAKSRGFSVLKTDTTENAQRVPWKAYSFWRKMGYEDKGVRLSTEYSFKVIPLTKNLK